MLNIPKSLNAILARRISNDGRINSVIVGDKLNGVTTLTYFNLLGDGYNIFSMQHVITATTVTYEGSNDDDSFSNDADEMISAANNRTFAGAGNWAADGSGAVVAVGGGVLAVTAGIANTGAKLPIVALTAIPAQGCRLVIGFDISLLGPPVKVSLLVGSQIVATGLANGAGQTVTCTLAIDPQNAKDKISFVADAAGATFSLDNITVKGVTATWVDITKVITGDPLVVSFTATGIAVAGAPIPVSRLRQRALTTNNNNALLSILSRMRI